MASPSQPKAKKPERSAAARWALALLKLGLGLGLVAAILLAVAVAISMASLPTYEQMMRTPNGQSILVKSADGAALVSVGPSYGEWLRYDEIPQTMRDAMVAVEDRRFWGHPGVDPIGTARSVMVRLQRGYWAQGGSTITQQLARNIFLNNNKNFARKGREAVLALALEQRFTKKQILGLYLNRVYFGGGAYGIDAASRKFFGHSARRLSLEEASIIAGLVKAPSRYAPSSDPRLAKARAKTVIDLMAETGKISEAEAQRADLGTLAFAPQPRQNDVRYFTDWVLDQLDDLTDERAEPLIVTTTLLPGMQRAAEVAIKGETPEGAQGALVAMSTDGAVRAMVGGVDYVSSIYNRAVVAQRQAGSAFKLFVYLTAFENGVEPDDIVVDQPVTYGDWSPRNDVHGYIGETTVRDAFARSINTVAVQLAARVGFDAVAETARRFGITTKVDTFPAMALGTSSVRPIELTAAYASVARGGVQVIPYAITRVETQSGKVLFNREPEAPRQLVQPSSAAKMTDLLQAVVTSGTGRAAQIGRPIAGKTGTTQSNKDGWFLGFTGDLTAGVWMGRDDNKRVAGLAGGRAPTRAFATFMRAATKGMPAEALNTEISADTESTEPDAEVYGLSPNGTDETPDDPAATGVVQPETPSVQPPAVTPHPPQGQMIVPHAAAPAGSRLQPRLDDKFLDDVLADPPRRRQQNDGPGA